MEYYAKREREREGGREKERREVEGRDITHFGTNLIQESPRDTLYELQMTLTDFKNLYNFYYTAKSTYVGIYF